MNGKILVVDDEKPIRELLKYKLTSQGFEVVTAKNEKEFFDKANNQKPDLIILDIWLKNKIGTDSYHHLLRSGFSPDVPVIFITALIEGYPKEAPLSGSKYALYSKPFNFTKLLSEIEGLIRREEEKKESAAVHGGGRDGHRDGHAVRSNSRL
jgi:DNA-binding response OmpR family regulator